MNNLSNKLVHLTNDAVQKKSEDYGKFENGNKVRIFLLFFMFVIVIIQRVSEILRLKLCRVKYRFL